MNTSVPRPGGRQQRACTLMCDVWAAVAQRQYGFDQTSARRLAFIRWLYATGRLGDRVIAPDLVSS